jgi:hypothetical protein
VDTPGDPQGTPNSDPEPESKSDSDVSAEPDTSDADSSTSELAAAVPEPFVVTIGDVGVTRHWVVTPNGHAPVAGSRWIILDLSRTDKKIPTWAIVLAVVFALACLLGLLFLLVREEQTTGYVEVTVMSGSLTHVTQIPVRSQGDIAVIRQQVHQAQTLAAAAAAQP